MSESKNSNPLELTKEEKDTAYKSMILFQEIETDLANAELTMHGGKFFDSMDYLTEGKTKLSIATREYKIFIKILKDKKIW